MVESSLAAPHDVIPVTGAGTRNGPGITAGAVAKRPYVGRACDQTSSMRAIWALSPSRPPSFRMRVYPPLRSV